jgi:hypothetical protein
MSLESITRSRITTSCNLVTIVMTCSSTEGATSPGHQATDSMVTRWGYLCGYLMRGCCSTESSVNLKVEDFSTMWEST